MRQATTVVDQTDRLTQVNVTLDRLEQIRTLTDSLKDAPYGGGEHDGYAQRICYLIAGWKRCLEGEQARLAPKPTCESGGEFDQPTHNVRDFGNA